MSTAFNGYTFKYIRNTLKPKTNIYLFNYPLCSQKHNNRQGDGNSFFTTSLKITFLLIICV